MSHEILLFIHRNTTNAKLTESSLTSNWQIVAKVFTAETNMLFIWHLHQAPRCHGTIKSISFKIWKWPAARSPV